MLTILYGCMFAGKTTLAYNMAKRNYSKQYIYFELVNSNLRYTHELLMQISISSPSFSCIIIDEFQFLQTNKKNEIQYFFDTLDPYHVIVSLLDMDYTAQKFQVFSLLQDLYATKDNSSVIFRHVKGKCSYCDNESLYSSRISHHTEQIVLDKNMYEATCKKCFEKNLNNRIIDRNTVMT